MSNISEERNPEQERRRDRDDFLPTPVPHAAPRDEDGNLIEKVEEK